MIPPQGYFILKYFKDVGREFDAFPVNNRYKIIIFAAILLRYRIASGRRRVPGTAAATPTLPASRESYSTAVIALERAGHCFVFLAKHAYFVRNNSRTSAVSSTNFRSTLIFASCVVGPWNILNG